MHVSAQDVTPTEQVPEVAMITRGEVRAVHACGVSEPASHDITRSYNSCIDS